MTYSKEAYRNMTKLLNDEKPDLVILNLVHKQITLSIIDAIKVILERTPPELGADIYRHGLYLTGGASQVNRFASMVQKGTGLKVNMTEKPMETVALGLSKIIKDDNYKSLAYAIEGMGGR